MSIDLVPTKMTVKSDLKKYAKLNEYSANSYSKSSFIKHLSAKFNLSEFELNKAVNTGKLRIYI